MEILYPLGMIVTWIVFTGFSLVVEGSTDKYGVLNRIAHIGALIGYVFTFFSFIYLVTRLFH